MHGASLGVWISWLHYDDFNACYQRFIRHRAPRIEVGNHMFHNGCSPVITVNCGLSSAGNGDKQRVLLRWIYIAIDESKLSSCEPLHQLNGLRFSCGHRSIMTRGIMLLEVGHTKALIPTVMIHDQVCSPCCIHSSVRGLLGVRNTYNTPAFKDLHQSLSVIEACPIPQMCCLVRTNCHQFKVPV